MLDAGCVWYVCGCMPCLCCSYVPTGLLLYRINAVLSFPKLPGVCKTFACSFSIGYRSNIHRWQHLKTCTCRNTYSSFHFALAMTFSAALEVFGVWCFRCKKENIDIALVAKCSPVWLHHRYQGTSGESREAFKNRKNKKKRETRRKTFHIICSDATPYIQ